MLSGNLQRAIGVFSKAPCPGNVKSRLSLVIGAEAAASLYCAFLRDVLVTAASIPASNVTVFHRRNDDTDLLANILPPGTAMQCELGAGFSEMLPNALRSMLDAAPVAALVGADSPALPQQTIEMAFDLLESGGTDVAICRTADGGFCVLAVAADHPGLFDSIDWGTGRVYSQVLANVSRLGLRVAELPGWFDVDDGPDLEHLSEQLASNIDLAAASTRRVLRGLREAGGPLLPGEKPWQVHSRRMIYETPWRSLVADRLTTHSGESIEYPYLETGDAVWVVPVTRDGEVLLIRQYRHPIGEIILEVPAGGGAGASDQIARRELQEETGGVARELIEIASFYPSSAHLTHEGHIFAALGVETDAASLEPNELLAVQRVPLDLAVDMARRGEVADSQSALAILAAEPAIRAALS